MKLIPLTQGKCALVDDQDFDWLSRWKWHTLRQKNGNWYALRNMRRKGKQKIIWMHREILKPPANMETDHKDRNGLNNQRENLRPATKAQNQHNRRTNKKGTSVFKGISWYRSSSKWQARIQINKKRKHLGYFRTERSAAIVYNSAAKKYFGEFARLNTVQESEVNHEPVQR